MTLNEYLLDTMPEETYVKSKREVNKREAEKVRALVEASQRSCSEFQMSPEVAPSPELDEETREQYIKDNTSVGVVCEVRQAADFLNHAKKIIAHSDQAGKYNPEILRQEMVDTLYRAALIGIKYRGFSFFESVKEVLASYPDVLVDFFLERDRVKKSLSGRGEDVYTAEYYLLTEKAGEKSKSFIRGLEEILRERDEELNEWKINREQLTRRLLGQRVETWTRRLEERLRNMSFSKITPQECVNFYEATGSKMLEDLGDARPYETLHRAVGEKQIPIRTYVYSQALYVLVRQYATMVEKADLKLLRSEELDQFREDLKSTFVVYTERGNIEEGVIQKISQVLSDADTRREQRLAEEVLAFKEEQTDPRVLFNKYSITKLLK